MSLSLLIGAFAVSLLFVMVTIIYFKLHPFMALLLGALTMGLVVGMPLPAIGAAIASGFGGTMSGIGIVIVLGIILGQLLYESGATEEIATTMLRFTGEKKATLAVNLTGVIVSVPVFFDAAFVILINLIKQLSKKGRIPFITLVCALGVGLLTTHCLVIPTPGPLAVAGAIGCNIGWMVFYGLIVSVIAAYIAGVLYATKVGANPAYSAVYDESMEPEIAQAPTAADMPEVGKRPSGGLGIFLIFLPIFIILLGTVATTAFTMDAATTNFFKFLGDKNIALLIGVLVAFVCLKKYLKRRFEEVITTCGEQAGAIFIITGAGGSLAGVINATGIGKILVENMSGLTSTSAGALIIVIGYVISQTLRATTGSATVALVTTAGLLAPVVQGLPISPVLVALGICAGGIGLSLPNDSGFWVVSRFANFNVKQTVLAWSIPGTIAGVSAVVILLVLNLVAGILPGL